MPIGEPVPAPTIPSTSPVITGSGGSSSGGTDKASRRAARRNPVTTTTTTSNVPSGATKLTDQAMGLIEGFSPPTMPTAAGDLVAPFNPNQIAAQNMAVGAAPAQQQIMSSAAGANTMLTNPNILSPESNPALQAWQTAAGRPLIESYMRDIMPAIGSGAADAGQFGSSKHGVAQGLAAGALTNSLSDTNANIANQGYAQGLQAMLQGIGLAPQTAAGQNIPAATVGAVGDVQQGQQQAEMDASTNASWLNQMMPWYFAQDLIGTAGAIPGGSTTVTQPGPKTGPIQSMIGGALTGAGAIPGRPLLGALIGGGTGIGSYFAG